MTKLFFFQFLEEMFEFSAVEIASQKDRMRSNPDVKERVDNVGTILYIPQHYSKYSIFLNSN